jgi:hypothetical protein
MIYIRGILGVRPTQVVDFKDKKPIFGAENVLRAPFLGPKLML